MIAVGLALSSAYSMLVWRVGIALALRITSDREVDLLGAIGGRRAAT